MFIRVRWIPGLVAFAGIGSGIHALWASDYTYVVAILPAVLIGWLFWIVVDGGSLLIPWPRRFRPWRLLALYVPSAIACWGIGWLAGIKNGTGGSMAAGYGGGFVLTLALMALVRRWRPAVRVERWRAAAVELRRNNPALYQAILARATDPEAARAAAGDPDAYVAIFLSMMEESGLTLDELVRESPRAPTVSTWPFEVLGVPVASSPAEVRRAYRALVQRFHPDHNPGDDAAHDRFLSVQAAYEELGSP